MKRTSKRSRSVLSLVIAAGLAVFAAGASPAVADNRDHGGGYNKHRGYDRGYDRGYKKGRHDRWHGPVHRGRPHHAPRHRVRYHRNVTVVRPYGHWYKGYGHHHRDDDAFAWLAFTAITLKVLDNLNESQQRAHEAAQIRATSAPIGDTIVWNQAGATGGVTVVRDGYSSAGRYCREFQQSVTVGGRSEEAYGTACMQPDGAWEIVSTAN